MNSLCTSDTLIRKQTFLILLVAKYCNGKNKFRWSLKTTETAAVKKYRYEIQIQTVGIIILDSKLNFISWNVTPAPKVALLTKKGEVWISPFILMTILVEERKWAFESIRTKLKSEQLCLLVLGLKKHYLISFESQIVHNF